MINHQSELAKIFWRQGYAADCPILDMHAHMGRFNGGYIVHDTAELMLESMSRCRALMACFVSHDSLFAPQAGIPKDLAVARQYPDKFKAYHVVSSHHLDPLNDLQRVTDNQQYYVGFKFHGDSFKVPLSDSRHQPYWEYANQRGSLILCHTWQDSPYNGPDEVEKIVSQYKDLVFIAAHSFHADWQSAVRLARKYPNVYLELTAVLDDRGALDYMVHEVGSDRILFGVDLPWFSYYHGIGSVLSARISDDDRRNIFYRNAKKLLSRFNWFDSFWSSATDNLI